MIKTNGAEFKRFYNDESAWPETSWHEEETLIVNGDEWTQEILDIPDNATVTILDGVVFGLSTDTNPSMELHFKRWKKRQTTTTILVECDQAKLYDIKVAVKSAGGKVL